jgi:hypothetical protein
MTVAIVGMVEGLAGSRLTSAARTTVVAVGVIVTWKGYCI